MITNGLIELLKEYKIFDDIPDLEGDWVEEIEEEYEGDNQTIVEILLGELLDEVRVDYAFDIGGWDAGDFVGLFSSTITDFVSASKSVIKVDNLKTVNPINDDPNGIMTIEFNHEKKHYKWEFNSSNSGKYFREITQWAENILDGNILFLGDEEFSAYCIPKELVIELSKKYGVESRSKPW